ncbi:MAG: CDP-diacylglycerol--serine O-phosphatidyltransferase [Candidatus Omnitrophota bacterium]
MPPKFATAKTDRSSAAPVPGLPRLKKPRRFRIRNLRPKRKNIKVVHLLPNVLTSFNVACGVSSIILGIDKRFEVAAFFILLAAFFDLIDGKVARLFGSASPFGVQLDSLADVISFGVAPPVLLHTILYQQSDRLGLSLVLIYTLFTALRLARYNVHANIGQKRDHFTGLPCPVPACFLAATVLVCIEYGIAMDNAYFRTGMHIVMISLACLMVSTVSYPDLSSWHIERRNIFQHNVIMVLVLCVTVLIFKTVIFFLSASFILSGPINAFRAMGKTPVEESAPEETKSGARETVLEK